MDSSAIAGCILGTAVGDSIGLPYEGMSRHRAKRLLGPPTKHRLFLGKGMVSDDTELTCLVGQSLLASNGIPEAFERELARRLRWWLVMLPAGVGFATLRSVLKLWLGFSPKTSGIFSAGNGPAMRSAIIGATHRDVATIKDRVRISTRITHRDPKAELAALAIALASFIARESKDPIEPYLEVLSTQLPREGDELLHLIQRAAESVRRQETTQQFATQLGLEKGVSGYSYHTVPVAIHAWFRHSKDLRSAVTAVVECGGDTDTTAAIVGGIVGTGVGEKGIPGDWLQSLWEWPRTVTWMRQMANCLEQSSTGADVEKLPEINSCSVLRRNLVFLTIVLYHGFRRLLPPY